jgi:1D-myo-inositol 3-kinase
MLDFLAIGHVAKDLTPDGFRLGGAVTYGALTAQRLGLNPAVVTSAGPGVDPSSAMPGIPLHVIPSAGTTTFKNTYHSGRRTQFIRGVGGPIAASDIPESWRSAPLVMLGPLAGEISCELAQSFSRRLGDTPQSPLAPNPIIIASIQGWLRQWDETGRVTPGKWDGREVLPHVDAAILSEDDIEDYSLLETWKNITRVLVFTRGSSGAEIHFDGHWHHVDAFPSSEVDPTGAGDVFAAAYLVRYSETSDVLESARFASCAASFCIQAEGTEGIPMRAQVEARLRG